MPGAKICEYCEDKMFTTDLGACSDCPSSTASSAFTYCAKCAAKENACIACGEPFEDKFPRRRTADSDKPETD